MQKPASLAAEKTTPEKTNQLEHAASSYLRSARHQPVDWQAWGEAAFARAQKTDRPILLDIGAVWCHWCHVMDRESYEDAEIAAVINQNFVAVKVDRDERPDVDARYQAAVSAISGQGGWPLTGFLTPDGRPFFGGTYFPRDDRYGRPGFGRILMAMATVWRERREEALETASSVMAAIEHNESFSGRAPGGDALSTELAEKIAESVLKQFDPRNGGFGAQPKFPHPAALDLLLQIAVSGGREHLVEEARKAFTVTLEKIARGGVYDQLAGGFHRYSVDERWVVPHFEKMLYDNTELLRNYVHGYQSFVREDFLMVAREIVAWLDAVMTDRERGGFYASQDADVGMDDDGDYFTWTLDEARAVLDKDELELAAQYYDIGELGDMHHNPAKNVLHVKDSLVDLALKTARPVESLRPLLESARRKLLAARAARQTPFIDRTLYTGWNAMAVTAYCETARVLRMNEVRNFALKTLDRILADAWDGEAALDHVMAYPDGLAAQEKAPGTLEDYAFTVHACLDAWLGSGEMRYYRAAVKLADAMIARFHDPAAGAFFDAAAPEPGALPLGALSARRKPLQDAPTPAGNPTAAAALLRLEALSGLEDYRRIAEETLACFAGIVEHFGLYAGSYGLALERLLADPVQVVVVGGGAEADRLEATAMAGFQVNKTVVRIDPTKLVPGGLPVALEETILHAPRPAGANACHPTDEDLSVGTPVWAYVCTGRACLPPVTGEDALLKALGASN
jgi:uncharacterized protein